MITPSSTSAFFPLGTSQCGLRCRKAVQDKIVLFLSRNLRQVLQKTIAFRLPHRGQSRLVPVGGRNNNNNNNYGKRRREERETRGDADGDVGLLVGCPAGYGLQNSHCSPCQAGHHSQDLSSRCKKCAPGTYQPGLGARICRVCTNPFVEDCYDTIWNYSPIFAGAVLVMVIVGLIFYHKFCCRERQKTQDNSDQDETRCPLITHNQTQDHFDDDDDDDEVIWEKNKKKKRKFFKKFIKTNDNSMQPYIFGIDMVPKRKSEVQRCDKVKTIPVCCIDSYRSHGEHCRECKHPQHRAYISQHCSRKNSRPPVPFPDFDR